MRIRKFARDILVLATSILPCVMGGWSKYDDLPVEANFKTQGINNLNILVIPVIFSDHLERRQKRNWELDLVFNSNVIYDEWTPTGSVREFIKETTYEEFNINFVVHDWIFIPQTEKEASSYAATTPFTRRTAGMRGPVKSALDQLDEANYDFSPFYTNATGFKQVILVHSGYGGEIKKNDCWNTKWENRVRSHYSDLLDDPWISKKDEEVKFHNFVGVSAWYRMGGSNCSEKYKQIQRIGTIAHELIHLFGMPDTYDINGDGRGLGKYDLMANSWGYKDDNYFPPNMGIFSKYMLGLVSPREIEESGTFHIGASHNHRQAWIIKKGMKDGEYLLIENRQPIGRDALMPGGGLLIFHIDENKPHQNAEGYPTQSGWPTNNKHYRIALLQADGKYDLEKDKNNGDAGDFFHNGWVNQLGPDYHDLHHEVGPYPNTDSYSNYNIKKSKILIYHISESAEKMVFKVSFSGLEIPHCSYYQGKKYKRKCKKAKKNVKKFCKKTIKNTKKKVSSVCKRECGTCQPEPPPPCQDDVTYRHWNVGTQDCETISGKNQCEEPATGYVKNVRKHRVKDYCKTSCNNCQ